MLAPVPQNANGLMLQSLPTQQQLALTQSHSTHLLLCNADNLLQNSTCNHALISAELPLQAQLIQIFQTQAISEILHQLTQLLIIALTRILRLWLVMLLHKINASWTKIETIALKWPPAAGFQSLMPVPISKPLEMLLNPLVKLQHSLHQLTWLANLHGILTHVFGDANLLAQLLQLPHHLIWLALAQCGTIKSASGYAHQMESVDGITKLHLLSELLSQIQIHALWIKIKILALNTVTCAFGN